MRDTCIRESLTQKQWDCIFYLCPGAWAGNKPEPNCHGSIVIDGAGITAPGRTDWSQRAPGAGQVRIWFGSPNQGLVPAGT